MAARAPSACLDICFKPLFNLLHVCRPELLFSFLCFSRLRECLLILPPNALFVYNICLHLTLKKKTENIFLVHLMAASFQSIDAKNELIT